MPTHEPGGAPCPVCQRDMAVINQSPGAAALMCGYCTYSSPAPPGGTELPDRCCGCVGALCCNCGDAACST